MNVISRGEIVEHDDHGCGIVTAVHGLEPNRFASVDWDNCNLVVGDVLTRYLTPVTANEHGFVTDGQWAAV